MYKTVIFDVDGTIIDTEYAVLSSLQKMLKEDYSKYYEFEELHFVLGIPGAQSLPKLGIHDVVRASEIWNRYMKEYYNSIKVYDGMSNVLESLVRNQIITGIVTSKTREELLHDFVPFGLMQYLSFVVCADDTKAHKPNPEPILKFLEVSKADPKSSIYIGDTAYDLECASSAGVDFALALWGSKTSEVTANYKIEQPAGILQLWS